MWIMKQILAFLFCFTRELNLYTPLTFSLRPPIHPYLTHHPPIHPFLKPHPQPFCLLHAKASKRELSGDDSWTYGRLTGIKKKHPLHPP